MQVATSGRVLSLPVRPAARPRAARRAPSAVSAAAGNAPAERGSGAAWLALPLQRAAAAAGVGCLAAALLLAAQPAAAKDLVQGVPRVVDGDTLDFSGTRVRLFGIDAPETKQSCSTNKGAEYMCGERSKEALAEKIGKSTVQCEQKNRDKYGRIVGVCSLPRLVGEPEDLNAWLVKEGLAVAYRQYSKDYVPLEEEARAAQRGIWSGTFEVPAQWRVNHPRTGGATVVPVAAGAGAGPVAPLPAGAARGAPPPPGCPIKGNITAKGEKIYHVPGGAFYDRTVIELEEGERYFCTTAEAEAAGWRASRS